MGTARDSRHSIRTRGHGRPYYMGRPRNVRLPRTPQVDRTPLGDFLIDEWLPALRVDVEPNTYHSAQFEVRTYIVPRLGAVPVCDISHWMLREYYQELLRTPCRRRKGMLSKNSVIHIHAVLNWAFQSLVDSGRLSANPAWGARPRLKKSERYEPLVWTPQMVCDFLDYTATDELHALWYVLALTGMRRSEVLGLKWGDLSRHYTHVAVRRGLCQAGSETYITAPKAARARRVDLLKATITSLRAHRRKQMRSRRTAGNRPLQPSDFVFVRPSGEWLSPGWISQRFIRLGEQAGLPRIRLHDLRHTHATHLLESGASVKVVQERLGHSDPLITIDTYVHLLPTIQAQAVKDLEEFYDEVRK